MKSGVPVVKIRNIPNSLSHSDHYNNTSVKDEASNKSIDITSSQRIQLSQ